MSDESDFIDNELYLHYNQEFKATRIIDKIIYPTHFKVEADVWLEMDDLSQEDRDYYINLALVKINFWMTQVLDNSVIFSKKNTFAWDFLMKNGRPSVENSTVVCPQEPADDHIAMLLQSKLTSLSKEYAIFGGVTVTSDNSRGLSFTFVGSASEVLPDMKSWVGDRSYFDHPWWDRDDASTFDTVPEKTENLDEKPDYAYNLDFLGEAFKPNTEKVNTKVLKPSFKPTIIKNDD